jgi:hypothetical protein
MKMKLITFSFATILLSSMASVHGMGGLPVRVVSKLNDLSKICAEKVLNHMHQREIVELRKVVNMDPTTPDAQLFRICQTFKTKNTLSKIIAKAAKYKKTDQWIAEQVDKVEKIDNAMRGSLLQYTINLRTKAKKALR